MIDDNNWHNQILNIIDADDAKKLRQVMLETKIGLGPLLLEASRGGKLECMTALIDLGADVNFTNEDNESPVSFACARNQLKSAKLLYSHGADLNQPSNGASPLDIAVCWASPGFRTWLRLVGAVRLQDFAEWSWPPAGGLPD